MIARHITSHDETGMQLLGIAREIYRTPVQKAISELAQELAGAERTPVYTQRRILNGALITRLYPVQGRLIADSVYFETLEEAAQLYRRSPLGDGLFFNAAARLDHTVALPLIELNALNSTDGIDAVFASFNQLFTDADALTDIISILRKGEAPLALAAGMAPGEYSRRLYSALELILRTLPEERAASLEFCTLTSRDMAPYELNGFTSTDSFGDYPKFIYLPDGARQLETAPSVGDHARAEALLSSRLDDIYRSRLGDDNAAYVRYDDAGEKPAEAPAAQSRINRDTNDGPALTAADLERAQQALSASLRYANSQEFRRFTGSFFKLRRRMDAALYFRHLLMYSDYLHRLGHPMQDVYDAELAALYIEPPQGLLASQIALTLTGYPGALSGALRHMPSLEATERFVSEAMPRMESGEAPDQYMQRLLGVRATLLASTDARLQTSIMDAAIRAATVSIPLAVRKLDAATIMDVSKAIDMLLDEDRTVDEAAFDILMSKLIDRVEFKRLDEYDEDTYHALSFLYSYVSQWEGLKTDKQRAVYMWGRLMDGGRNWQNTALEDMLGLLRPMSPANRLDFMNFMRRYFAAMCADGIEPGQLTASVTLLTLIIGIKFDGNGNAHFDNLSAALDQLCGGDDETESAFWRMLDVREELLPMNMLEEAGDTRQARRERAEHNKRVQTLNDSRYVPPKQDYTRVDASDNDYNTVNDAADADYIDADYTEHDGGSFVSYDDADDYDDADYVETAPTAANTYGYQRPGTAPAASNRPKGKSKRPRKQKKSGGTNRGNGEKKSAGSTLMLGGMFVLLVAVLVYCAFRLL